MEEEEQGDKTRRLPDDALAGVLGRLAPHGLAASRCVCRAWRGIIDGRDMMRPRLLPRSLAGIFINFNELSYAEFFCRPQPPPSEGLGVRERIVENRVKDHCNGLLLLYGYVANPVTGWEEPLPPPPPPSPGMERFIYEPYLVYDPAVSSHYQVFLVPQVPYVELDVDSDEEGSEIELDMEPDEVPGEIDPAVLQSEWPPSVCPLQVFSSLTGRWEEMTFVREGEAAGTVADLATDYLLEKRHAVYWRDALYVHCAHCFVMRLSLSDDTYRVIKPLVSVDLESCGGCHLGKSKKGVYFALTHIYSAQLQVWILNERSRCTEWVLEHDIDLKPLLQCLDQDQQVYGPWILQDVNYNEEKYIGMYNDNESTITGGDFEWNSDNDVQDTEDMVDKGEHNGASILGFHPFKEIVFLSSNMSRGLAYHLNNSKLEDLGSLYPKYYREIAGPRGLIEASFTYTPCWI